MIYLVTGKPGSGKSYYMTRQQIAAVANIAESFGTPTGVEHVGNARREIVAHFASAAWIIGPRGGKTRAS